jgi:hypothetical protein
MKDQGQFELACKLAQDNYLAGNRPRATEILTELVLRFPEQPQPIYQLGMMLADDGQDHLAIPMLRDCLRIKPEASVICNLASLLKRQEHTDEARELYRQALEMQPDHPMCLTGLAGCYVNGGNPMPGIAYARRALAIEGPHQPHVRNTLALLLLEADKWEEGWQHYRRRDELPIYHKRDFGDVPRWDGKNAVRHLAIHAEQGLGDESMFMSCVPELRGLCERLTIEVNPQMVELFKRSFPWAEFVGTHEEHVTLGKPDAYDRLGDLPSYFRPSRSSCPGKPFLKPDMAKVAGYRARLYATGPGPYIGFAWLGGTKATHQAMRRAPRELWKELIDAAPGTRISLQYGPEGERHANGFGITHWWTAIADMDEFAALVSALDLVVTSPQTAVHISGGLGKRCLVAMSSKPAWRYGVRGQMGWYESVELVRATTDDWKPVFFKLRQELADLGRLQAA